MTLQTARSLRNQNGLTYVEALLAVLVLSVCLTPGVQALRDNLAQRATLQTHQRDVECVKQALEKTLAEPYENLLPAASSAHAGGSFSLPSLYSLPADAVCTLPRNVYILRYDPALSTPFSTTSNDMLYVRAEIANGTALATLAIRK